MIYGRYLVALAPSTFFFGSAVARGGANQRLSKVVIASSATVASSVDTAVAVSATASAVAGTAAGVASVAGAASRAARGSSTDVLNPANVQTGSQSNGQAASGASSGQAVSATDAANFINFCTGKTLTNGLQVKAGSCNGIVMGDIPSASSMISTIITSPAPGSLFPPSTTFTVSVLTTNLLAGSFTNPSSTYYAAPQSLSPDGKVVGHTHVVIQSLGNTSTPATPPDPAVFVFFKGVNDQVDGKGGLSATVTGGLPEGMYRVCTMASGSNHQPVLMPVAQRGAQDDCTKFMVGTAGSSAAAPSPLPSASSASGTAPTAPACGNGTTAATAGGSKGKGRKPRFGGRRAAGCCGI